jgi:cytochrome c-type biogenesis protein CcmI
MPEPIVLLLGLLAAAALVVPPLLRSAATDAPDPGERDAAAVRHRVALETLRDVEADRRSGSLDDAAYAEQLAEAEARAASTRAALETASARQPDVIAQRHGGGVRVGLVAAGAIGVALLAGAMLPPTGIANRTVVNQALADAQDAEAARQAWIGDLLDALAQDGDDTRVLSDLADAYLAGSTGDDLARAVVALQALIGLEPERADAYERVMSAYLRAGDYANARAAHDTYAEVATADPVELAFFDGLIALRGEDDPAAAAEAFDRFLELAPDDPRAGMVRGLRDQAAAGS